jgi:hypothetical protein
LTVFLPVVPDFILSEKGDIEMVADILKKRLAPYFGGDIYNYSSWQNSIVKWVLVDGNTENEFVMLRSDARTN